MRLSDTYIRNSNILSPFCEECLNPSSYDIRWSGRYLEYKIYKGTVFGMDAMIEGWSEMKEADSMLLKRGSYYLLDTMEYLTMPPNISGILLLKSTHGRRGMQHSMSGYLDPGFCGTLTLEIYTVAEEMEIVKGQRIAQLVFDEIYPAEKLYQERSGHYQGQKTPTLAYEELE